MNNKKILVSFLLVVLVALSVSAVSAEDASDVVAISDDDVVDVAVDDVISESYKPANNTAADVQSAIDSANESDTVDLSNFDAYDFGNSTVTIKTNGITLQGNGNTTISGHGVGDGLIFVNNAANVTIKGIKFIDTNPKNNLTYGGEVSGIAVKCMGATNALVEDCEFTDFNQDIRVQRSQGVTIQNNQFNGGYSTKLLNDPTVNEETGTKALNIMGSTGVTVKGNNFIGPVLDAVSIASGSGSNVVENNYFENNSYSIFFGGASTKGSVIRKNTFVNCGYFKEGDVEWKELPVISIQKSSNDISIEQNEFKAANYNVLIASEQGNEAHGFPTTVGNVNVTNNTVSPYTSDVVGRTVTLMHVLCRDNTTINLDAVYNVDDNTLFPGVKEVVLWYSAWGDESEVKLPVNNTAQDVQAQIDAANPGDIIDLTTFKSYDFFDSGVVINKEGLTLLGDGNTTIYGFGNGDGLVYINNVANVTIQGIRFIDTNPDNNFVYNGTVAGIGVKCMGANDGLIDNCFFRDFNQDIRVQRSSGITIQNSLFVGGYTTYIRNDPTVNVETGTKCLNIMGSSKVTVKDNIFIGQVLDAVSIASGSGSNVVENNYFEGNTYSIYFGGASTKGSSIRNNTFVQNGYFEEGEIVWIALPVISIQKAANDIEIVDNAFTAIDYNILIAAEQGNEAHGFPTSLGNINVTGNVVIPFDNVTDVNTVVLFNIYCRNGNLNLSAPIDVTNNTVAEGVNVISLQTTGDTYLAPVPEPVAPTATVLTASAVTVLAGDEGKLTVTLKDTNGNAIAGQNISVLVDGEPLALNAETDANGTVVIPVKYSVAGTKYAYAYFIDDSGNYLSSLDVAKITINKKSTTLTAKAATLKVKKAKKISVTLKSSGKAVANKKVTIKVNGKTFSAKTNSKGIAKVSVKVTKKGKFTATVKFAGDSAYKAVTKNVKFTVKK